MILAVVGVIVSTFNTKLLAQEHTPVHRATLQARSHGSVKEWLLPPQISYAIFTTEFMKEYII